MPYGRDVDGEVVLLSMIGCFVIIMFACVYMYTWRDAGGMDVWTYAYMYVCVRVCVCTHTHTHTHITSL